MKLIVNTGMRVADRFTILRFIAEGGMGEVYEARDEVLGERVALKFLSHRNLGDENVTRRFRREIQLARKVTHPNVCRVYDLYQHQVQVPGTQQNMPVAFVTMELLSGETLEDRIQKGGRLTETESMPVIVQMCRALQAAHEAGVIHRDFKSNNVMLVPGRDQDHQRVVVTDFGLARSMIPNDPSRTPLTADSLILGTADYMSPEQIRGDPVSPKSDLYSLGVVMFEMLTAGKPYNAPNPMQLLVKRVSEPPARPSELTPGITPTWETVIMSCLAEDPGERPGSAEEVVQSLEITEELNMLYPPVRREPAPHDTSEIPGLQAEEKKTVVGWLAPIFIVALAALAWWGSREAGDAGRAISFNPQRLSSAPGVELDPDISSDGSRLVYSAEQEDGGFRLIVQGLEAGSLPKVLDTGEGQAFEPIWSPDDEHILFHRRPDQGIWQIPAEGGEPVNRVEQGSRPAFSADGRKLVYQTGSSPLFSDTTVPAFPPSVIAILDLETQGHQPLTEPNSPDGGHGSPLFSPNGQFVVFAASRRSVSELWAVEIESKRLIPILRTPAAYDPAISADGRSLFFVSRQREVKGLWRVEIDPSSMEPVSLPREVAGVGLSSIRQPMVGPNGELVFAAYLTRSNLWSVSVDADGSPVGRPRALTVGNDRYNRPAFSPDGRFLAFDHWKLGIDIDVFQLELETGERRLLTRGNLTNSHASWLPDGRIVYSKIDSTGRTTVHRLDPVTDEEEMLFQLEKGNDWVKVSPDGRQVAFHSSRGGEDLDIWIRDLERGPSWRLTFHPEQAGFPAWSSRSDAVAYHLRVGNGTQLWLAPLKAGEPRMLVDAPGDNWPFGFSDDGKKVLFAGRREGRWNIYWASIETGEVKQLTDSLSLTGYLRYPTWSPVGDQVVYEKSETTSDLFLVEDFH